MNQAEHFLQQTQQKNWDMYMSSLQDASWDYVILTAANAQQALGFEEQIRVRREAGFLPERTVFGVVADPPGERVGNGGAVLGAVRYVAQTAQTSSFEKLKILVMLSSGDSRRAAQYSAMGKLFSPVPHVLPNGQASTLFDEMMLMLCRIPAKIQGGMLVISGDVMLAFDAEQFEHHGEDAIAIAFPEPVETGAHHGVFLANDCGMIDQVWHKQTADTLRSYGAVDAQNNVMIDTGAVFFSPRVTSALYGLICDSAGHCTEGAFRRYVNGKAAPSLYVDFFYPLAARATYDGYLKEIPEGTMCDEILALREEMWKALHGFSIRLLCIEPSRFIHFGSTQDVVRLMSEGISQYSFLEWQRQINSRIAHQNAAAYTSILEEGAQCEDDVYLESSLVHSGVRIGKGSILSCIEVCEGEIPPHVVVHGLKQADGTFVARIYGTDDNPKALLNEGATLFGKPLAQILSQHRLSASDLWLENEAQNLWSAHLYPACQTMQAAIASALQLYRIAEGTEAAVDWLCCERRSLQDSFNQADGQALIAWDSHMRQVCRK